MPSSVLLAGLLACAGPASAPDATATGRTDLRFVMVTHGQSSDPFWSVVANGAGDASRETGARLEYQAPTSFDMVRMSQLIDAAVASRPDGIIVSIPDADALAPSIRAAIAAGIPVIGINAGAGAWKDLGLVGYIGQTEYEAGRGAGDRLVASGAGHVLCVNHEVGNASQDERCRGLDDAMRAGGGTSTVLAVDLADPDDAKQRIASAIARDAGLSGMLTLGPTGAVPALAALMASGRSLRFGTFDLGPEVLRAVATGTMSFAIDQQPWLQGYLAVILMTKYVEFGVMPGGGDIIRTGPSFVTAGNAENVIRLTERGIR